MLRVSLVLPRACCAPDPLMWGFLLSGTRAFACVRVVWLCVRPRARVRVCVWCVLWLCAWCGCVCALCVWCGCARVRVCALGVWVRARGCVWVWVCGCPPPWSPGWEGGWGACCFCVVVLWRCPTLPRPVDRSTIGVTGLSFQVRNVAGRFPGAMTTTNFVSNLTDPARHQRSRACVGCACGGGGLIVVCIVVANSSRVCVSHTRSRPPFFFWCSRVVFWCSRWGWVCGVLFSVGRN